MTEALAKKEGGPVDAFRLVGTRLDGKYTVEALVAEGGFGIVYRCAHAELQKAVALKVLKVPGHLAATAKGEFFKKFTNEARTIARIEHEAIVRVLDFGTSIMPSGELAPWMALEWLDGVTLERDLDRRTEAGPGGRSPAETFALMEPVIEAVALAHEEGIAHRDIKPGNLMLVTNRRGEVRLKLLDFGIAKVMADDDRAPSSGQTSTQAHLQMFSLDYAAPEQMSGTRSGPWTDVHALGLVLSELLTGEQPYDGDDSVEIFSEALSRRRPTPARRGLDVGPWEPVLLRAMALRPADRFPNAGALLKALQEQVPSQAVWRASLQPALSPPASEPPSPAASDRPAAPASLPPRPTAPVDDGAKTTIMTAAAPPPPAPAPVATPAPARAPTPAAAVAAPATVAATRTPPADELPPSQRITELLPPAPKHDDDEPVQLPLHRVGGLAWVAALLAVVGVASALFLARRSPTVAVRPMTAATMVAPAAPAPAAPAATAPAATAPTPPVLPSAAPAAPPVPVAPAPVVAPPLVAAPPAPSVPPAVVAETPRPAARAPAHRPRSSGAGRIPIE